MLIKLRHPTLNEMQEVSNILLIGFYDKFTFLFKENLELGRKIFNEIYGSCYKERDLHRFLVAVHDKEILGTVEIHTRNMLGSFYKRILVFIILWRHFSIFKTIKKFIPISYMDFETVEKNSAYISSFVVKSDARNKGIGRKLISMTEYLALKRNCKYVTLHVIFRNKKARRLYKKLGFQIINSKTSALFKYFMGIEGHTYMKKELNSYKYKR